MDDGAAKCVEPRRAIPAEREELEGAMDALRQSIGDLEDRLTPVLKQPDPQEEGKDPDPPPCCPLAEGMRAASQQVRQFRDRVIDINDRVQL